MSKFAGKRECPTTGNSGDGGGGGSRPKKSGSSAAAASLLPPADQRSIVSGSMTSHAAAGSAAAAAAGSSSDLLDPFQWLGEDLLRLILSYVMCLPPRVEKPKPYQDAFSHYKNANLQRIKEGAKPDATSRDVGMLIGIEFDALSAEQKARWDELEQKDFERYENEMAAYRSIVRMPKRNQSAFILFSNANRVRLWEAHPDAGFGDIAKLIAIDFKALSTEERARWDELAQKDRERYVKEKHEEQKIIESPKRLAETCSNISSVSRSWRDVADDMMNQRAPTEVISPSDLANIKRRAASLDLSSVQSTFGERITEYDYRRPLPLYRSHEEKETDLEMIIEAVTVKYLKFLVVRAVEVSASKAKVEDEADKKSVRAIEAWKACSRQPSQLVDMFWHAHASHPEKYKRDCKALIGSTIEDGQDDQDGTDYKKKEQELFHFEEQFSLGYVRPDSVKTKALFHDSFDLSYYPIDSELGSDVGFDFGF